MVCTADGLAFQHTENLPEVLGGMLTLQRRRHVHRRVQEAVIAPDSTY